jgi:hypothetical protein
MQDRHSVFREKEQVLARVRREIQALLMVIPLLVDDPPTSDVVHEVPLASSQAPVNLPDNDTAQLEIYYPFVRHLRMSERAIPRVLSGDDLCPSHVQSCGPVLRLSVVPEFAKPGSPIHFPRPQFPA